MSSNVRGLKRGVEIMGWNGGHDIANDLIISINEYGMGESSRMIVYQDFIKSLESQDWESGDFHTDDTVFMKALREIHPDWDWDEDASVPTKPCIICERQLDSIRDTWDTMQPNDGGEVKFFFSYGSAKFDLCFGATIFKGVICDNCAHKLVHKMERADN